MIKNWTITTQAVKNGSAGVITREHYLMSTSHPNHKATEQIISLYGSSRTSQNIAMRAEQFKVRQMLNRRGGRPLESFAMEYCLTLPKKFRPTSSQWRYIVRDCCLALASKLELQDDELKDFKQQIRAVLHRQKQAGTVGTGDHVHLIVSKVVNGRVLKELQRKQATALLKQVFTSSVMEHAGIDHTLYKQKSSNNNKRLPDWRYQRQEAKNTVETMKLIDKLQKQAEKWFTAFNENDAKQKNRQFNRLTKTFEQLSGHSLTDEMGKQVQGLRRKIEAQARRKLSPIR